MSSHPNVAVIERMTQAIVENDRETLTQIFTDDMVFHGRGPIPFAGDHSGVDGLLAALGTVFELTDGDVKLEQLSCLADDEWGSEWERAVFGRADWLRAWNISSALGATPGCPATCSARFQPIAERGAA